MDHSSHGGGMGSSPISDGVPDLFYVQKIYWMVLGTAIALGTLVNVLNKLLALERYKSQQAKPRSLFWVSFATATAIAREFSYASLGTFGWENWSIRFPTLGRTSLVLSNVTVVLALCFYKLEISDPWSWEDVGYRTGFVSIAQLPLIVLLAGRDNLIGALTGLGYERLNWLHRWTARTLWLSATLHMGFWFRNWARYDYINIKLTTDPLTQRGFAAWCILTFVLVTSVAPMRKLNYEVFVVSHLVTFAGFTAAVWLHAPDEVKIWVWLPIGFFALDRLLRAIRILHLNLTLFHLRRRKANVVWANPASFTALPGDVTKISIDRPALRWKPGQHVFLSCHSMIPLQSHPFTIASLPSDGKLEFLIKAQRGGTKKFLNHALKSGILPLTHQTLPSHRIMVGIEGPYGRMRDLGQFHSVVFFAGSTGATFTIPHLRYIVQSWLSASAEGNTHHAFLRRREALTRRIRFVWVVKSLDQVDWFKGQLQKVIDDATSSRSNTLYDDRQVDISVYVTCDEKFVAEKNRRGDFCTPMAHGKAEEALLPTSIDRAALVKKDLGDEVEINDLTSKEHASSQPPSCAPGGSCCCRATVEDEASGPVCTCACPPSTTVSKASTVMREPELQKQLLVALNPPMKVVSGRPRPRSIIRNVLEEAEGESAVVVCGPQGLRDSVRESVVTLSDERAVHKGTGAQGIYLHVEGFEY